MTFTVNIPQSGQSLGVSRPIINTNFSVLNATISADHVPMNSANAGFHQQVTFPNNNPPADPADFPVTPSILFTNNQDGQSPANTLPGGLAELFYYSGTQAQSKTQYKAPISPDFSASAFAFGGMIIKCGRRAATDNTTISFATETGASFPNNCFSVVASPVGTTTSGATMVVVGSISATGFTPRILDKTGAPIGGQSISWMAIGN